MPKPSTRYFANLPGGETELIELEPLAPGRFLARLRGNLFEIDARHLENGALNLLLDGRSLEVVGKTSGDKVQLSVDGLSYTVDVADERRMRLRSAGQRSGAEGRQIVAAPMPGKVVRVLVKAGDTLEEGQGVVVVEAMKMENELKSPKGGTVVEVQAREGQTVEGGAPLVVIE